ncbi:MAG: ABC transporter permease [Anaerolineaceae bacterium]|nr:ABC transporter permease [Anaerolineaceae bacterium]
MKNFFSNSAVRETLRIVLAVGAALLLGFIVTLIVSEDPIGAYKAFLFGPLSKFNRFGDWIEESLTLILVGLSVAIAFKANQFSLGAEGQIYLGALVSGSIALFLPVPGIIRIPLALLAAMTIGFLWGWIPGYLKAHLDANEIVSTLMFNFIAIKLYDYFLIFQIKPDNAGYNASDFFPKEGVLPSFFFKLPFAEELRTMFVNQTNITIMLYIMIAAFIGGYYLMFRTPFGYQLRMIGANIKFARYGGINTKSTIILAFAVSGIFAGLAGAHLSMGIHTKLIANISMGLGFEGIVVATMARNNPLFIPISGLAYGYLRAGADVMERSSDVSREMVLVIQAIIILLVTAERILPVVQQRIQDRKENNENGNGSGEQALEGGKNAS